MPSHRRTHPVRIEMPSWGVFAIESQHAPEFMMAADKHDFVEVFYLIEGEGSVEIDDLTYECRPGQIVVIPRRTVHRFVDDPGCPLTMLGLAIAAELWADDTQLESLLEAGPMSLNPTIAARIRLQFRQLIFEQTMSRPASISVVRGVALQLLAQLARRGAADRERTHLKSSSELTRESIVVYIQELQRTFFERTNLDEVSARLGISRRRFTQLFREETGMSWSQFIVGLRIDHACHLLRNTNRSVERIAFECGYEEVSSFYRAFRKRHQVAPKIWRDLNS